MFLSSHLQKMLINSYQQASYRGLFVFQGVEFIVLTQFFASYIALPFIIN